MSNLNKTAVLVRAKAWKTEHIKSIDNFLPILKDGLSVAATSNDASVLDDLWELLDGTGLRGDMYDTVLEAIKGANRKEGKWTLPEVVVLKNIKTKKWYMANKKKRAAKQQKKETAAKELAAHTFTAEELGDEMAKAMKRVITQFNDRKLTKDGRKELAAYVATYKEWFGA